MANIQNNKILAFAEVIKTKITNSGISDRALLKDYEVQGFMNYLRKRFTFSAKYGSAIDARIKNLEINTGSITYKKKSLFFEIKRAFDASDNNLKDMQELEKVGTFAETSKTSDGKQKYFVETKSFYFSDPFKSETQFSDVDLKKVGLEGLVAEYVSKTLWEVNEWAEIEFFKDLAKGVLIPETNANAGTLTANIKAIPVERVVELDITSIRSAATMDARNLAIIKVMDYLANKFNQLKKIKVPGFRKNSYSKSDLFIDLNENYARDVIPTYFANHNLDIFKEGVDWLTRARGMTFYIGNDFIGNGEVASSTFGVGGTWTKKIKYNATKKRWLLDSTGANKEAIGFISADDYAFTLIRTRFQEIFRKQGTQITVAVQHFLFIANENDGTPSGAHIVNPESLMVIIKK